MKLIDTTVGELYANFSAKEIGLLDKYIQNNYSSPTNVIYKLHRAMVSCKDKNKLDKMGYDYIKEIVFNDRALKHTKLTTYVNNLYRIIKEFVILSKIESKNLYTEVLWSEYLIENNMKRNLIINQANYRIDLKKDQYPLQKEYYNRREKFFLTFIKSNKKSIPEIEHNTLQMVDAFEEYYQWQMIDNYKTLFSYIKFDKIISEASRYEDLYRLLALGKASKNKMVETQSLLLSIIVEKDSDSFILLDEIFENRFYIHSIEQNHLISAALINFCANMIGKDNYSIKLYNIFNKLYINNILFPTPAQVHTRLGTFLGLELKHGTTIRAKDILSNCIDQVSSVQRDSCEKLCLARIEFAEKNYEQARVYIDQGNTHDSLHYYPLFKTMLLKILIYLEDELRFVMERENLYKYLHKNKSLGEKNRTSYMQFYKYIDYMNESKFKSLSDYMRAKLKTAFEPSSDYFHDKEWMRERFQELIKNSSKE